jgi:hypothetical protein
VLNRYAHLAGATTSIEPRPFGDDDHCAPDLSITHFATTFIDVCIEQPDASSKRSALASLHDAERGKQHKYLDRLRVLGHSFLPAVASSHGVFSSSLHQLIRYIQDIFHANHPDADLDPPFAQQLSTDIACAIQMGNARILRDAISAQTRFHPPNADPSRLVAAFAVAPVADPMTSDSEDDLRSLPQHSTAGPHTAGKRKQSSALPSPPAHRPRVLSAAAVPFECMDCITRPKMAVCKL